MIKPQDFTEIRTHCWRLAKRPKENMRVDTDVFASKAMLLASIHDGSIRQAINVATLPGIVSSSIAMPDIHYGYGFCIGGVAAFEDDSGIVSPGGVGYDINCGVRLLATRIPHDEFSPRNEQVGYAILREIPTGLKPHGGQAMSRKDFLRLIKGGAAGAADHFGGDPATFPYIESNGTLPFENEGALSKRAIERGRMQLGSLGSGNHFIEVQQIEKIYDATTARQFGLFPGNIAIMIHTGSRGFGHQIASDYIELFRKNSNLRERLVDPQLIYAPIESSPGRRYLQALNAASNFAWANRQILMEQLVFIFERIFHSSRAALGIRMVYDQAHNIAKFEEHRIGDRKRRVLVHRKGATRAFPPYHSDLPQEYRSTGQPVLLPGSMGTASYVLKGTETAMTISLGSSAHGAGRTMSRHQAIKHAASSSVRERMKKKGILVFSHSSRGLKEEIPEAYKPIDEVVDVTETAGISRKVARLTPLVVIKG